jgi:putative PIN family toxin of toxin-antitoxin system
MASAQRAVFDTNVLISAYLWPGTPRKALKIMREGRCELVSAWPAVEEFVRVLGYQKFGLEPNEIEPFVEDLLSLVAFVEPTKTIRVVESDPADNLFIAIALAGNDLPPSAPPETLC